MPSTKNKLIIVTMKKVVVIDNYDSFTYNLVQAVATLPGSPEVQVFRNDAVTGEQLLQYHPTHLIFSPGPCTPNHTGNSREIIEYWAGKVPILGVCLGHQCLAQVFGAKIVRAKKCMHGKTSLIHHDSKGVFKGLPTPFRAMRYHSLIVDPETLNTDFTLSARTDTNEIMAIRNDRLILEGVQFHPESFATEHGTTILENFLEK